ncbi:hypothetical protein D3C78_1403940 [compost metagenome]
MFRICRHLADIPTGSSYSQEQPALRHLSCEHSVRIPYNGGQPYTLNSAHAGSAQLLGEDILLCHTHRLSAITGSLGSAHTAYSFSSTKFDHSVITYIYSELEVKCQIRIHSACTFNRAEAQSLQALADSEAQASPIRQRLEAQAGLQQAYGSGHDIRKPAS